MKLTAYVQQVADRSNWSSCSSCEGYTTTTHVNAAKEGDDDLHSFIKPPVEPQ